MKRIPIGIVTGFLGSGKTTLIAKALADERLRNTAVIVNEFGEVSLDHLIMRTVQDNIVELRNGCVCCTIREDLAMTLRDLLLKRALGDVAYFDYVVIETTGLADPRPLLHTLMGLPAFRQSYQPDVVVSCVDMTCGVATVREHEIAAGQIAMADFIVFTKGDLASEEQRRETYAMVASLNPLAETAEAEQGQIDPSRLFRRGLFEPGRSSETIRAWLRHDCAEHDHHHHDASDYRSHAILRDQPLSLAGTSVFLNRLVNTQKGGLLRIKGLAGFREKGGKPGVIHAVQDKFYPIQWLEEWPDEDHRSRLVIIGRDLDLAWCEELFDELCS